MLDEEPMGAGQTRNAVFRSRESGFCTGFSSCFAVPGAGVPTYSPFLRFFRYQSSVASCYNPFEIKYPPRVIQSLSYQARQASIHRGEPSCRSPMSALKRLN